MSAFILRLSTSHFVVLTSHFKNDLIVIIGVIFNVLIWQNIKLATLCRSTLPHIILKFSWHVKSQSLGALDIDVQFYFRR